MDKIVVKDANVFIDLELAGLLDAWLELPFLTITSSLVEDELISGDHQEALSYIRSHRIEAMTIDAVDFLLLKETYEDSGLSDTDVSVIYLAERLDAIVLTGDGRLRHLSEVRQLEVHGTLWIFDQLVEAEIMSGKVAAQKLDYLINLTGEQRRFLPNILCLEYMKKWTS